MNKADGFGLRETPSPGKEKDETVESQNTRPTIWGNLSSAIKNTAHYASHEFDRIFDAMGFKSNDAALESNNRDWLKTSASSEHNPQKNDIRYTKSVDSDGTSTARIEEKAQRPVYEKYTKAAVAIHRESLSSSTRSSNNVTERPSDKTDRAWKIQRLNSEIHALLNQEQLSNNVDSALRKPSKVRFSVVARREVVEEDEEDERRQRQVRRREEEILDGENKRRKEEASHKTYDHQREEDSRLARLERSINNIKSQMRELETMRETLVSEEACRLPPLTEQTYTFSHTSPSLPTPPPQSPVSVRSPPRITKKYSSPIKPHNINTVLQVLPRSTLVKDAYQKQKQKTVPNDTHLISMQQIVEQIPKVKLRRTDVLVGADGTTKPNPFWIEIYEPNQRYRPKRPLQTNGDLSSPKRRNLGCA